MEIYPLSDCIQVPLDDDYNEIIIYYYTDSPSKPYDAEARKMYDIPNETPLYLCEELWAWEDDKYVKKESNEEILTKEIAQALIKRYLKFMIPTHEWDLSYQSYYEKYKDYKHSLLYEDNTYYNLGNGGRWNRGWAKFLEDEEVTMMYGPVY